MTPEKIIGWFEQMGSGVVILAGVLVAAVFFVAFVRLNKKGKSAEKPSSDNPAGESGGGSQG